MANIFLNLKKQNHPKKQNKNPTPKYFSFLQGDTEPLNNTADLQSTFTN